MHNDHQQREDLGELELKRNKYYFFLHEAVPSCEPQAVQNANQLPKKKKDKIKT